MMPTCPLNRSFTTHFLLILTAMWLIIYVCWLPSDMLLKRMVLVVASFQL